MSSFLFLHCTLPSFELNLLWDQLRHNLKFFASEQDAKQLQFHSTFPFLGLSHLFVKKTFSTQNLLYRAFPSLITSIISNPTLKDCCCLYLYLLSLFIWITIIEMICDPFLSFEFCAISLLSQPAESRNEISPSKKKNGVFKFQLFLRVVGKTSPLLCK